jgi:hypothetical protein
MKTRPSDVMVGVTFSSSRASLNAGVAMAWPPPVPVEGVVYDFLLGDRGFAPVAVIAGLTRLPRPSASKAAAEAEVRTRGIPLKGGACAQVEVEAGIGLPLVGLIVDILKHLRAQVPGEAFIGNHDPGFDQHLVHRAVEHQQQLLDLFDSHPRLGEDQGVGADIGTGRATRGQEATASRAAAAATTTATATARTTATG